MRKREKPLAYFCVDLEASGPVPGLYNLVSIGCVHVAPSRPDARHEPGASFYAELRPIFPGFDRSAMKIHGITRAHLEREGEEPRAALAKLTRFVVKHSPAGGRAVFVGHNAPFDWSFINYYYHHEQLKNPFGYSALDTKALAMGTLGLTWPHSNKEVLQRRLELPEQEKDKVHRADYDAHYQALILCGLLDVLRERADSDRAGRSG